MQVHNSIIAYQTFITIIIIKINAFALKSSLSILQREREMHLNVLISFGFGGLLNTFGL